MHRYAWLMVLCLPLGCSSTPDADEQTETAPPDDVVEVHGLQLIHSQHTAPVLLAREALALGRTAHTYRIQNASANERTLVFEGSTCGCLAVKVIREGVEEAILKPTHTITLHPQGTLEVQIELLLDVRAASYAHVATFRTGAQQEAPHFHLGFTVPIQVELMATPSAVTFEAGRNTPWPLRKRLHVVRFTRNPSATPLQPEVKVAAPGQLSADVGLLEVVALANGLWRHSWEVALSYTHVPTGEPILTGRIDIGFGGEEEPQLRVPVTVHVRQGIRAHPVKLLLRGLKVGEQGERRLMLAADDEHPFSIVGVRSPSAAVKATFPQKVAVTHLIDVTVAPVPSGALDTEVIVETDHPQTKVVRIPLGIHAD